MTNLLPLQNNYIKYISEWEYNIGLVCELKEGIWLEALQVETALLDVVRSQEYLHQVYDRQKSKVRKKKPNELIRVEEISSDKSIEECTKDLQNLISEKSKIIHKEQSHHINLTLCNTPSKQLFIIVVDHFIVDGTGMAILIKLLELRLFSGKPMRQNDAVKKCEHLLDGYRNIDLHELNYWTDDLPVPDPNQGETYLNKEQQELRVKLNPSLTKQTLKEIKESGLKFDALMLSALNYAYSKVIGQGIGHVEITKSIRHYLKQKEFMYTIGPMVFFFPIKLEKKVDSMHASLELVMNQFKQVKGKELSYSLLSSDGKIPTCPSKVFYSNMGNVDAINDISDIIFLSNHIEGYFHGDTFDPEMKCDKDLFFRPYLFNGEQIFWMSYNPNVFSEEQINQLLNFTTDGMLDILAKTNVSKFVSHA